MSPQTLEKPVMYEQEERFSIRRIAAASLSAVLSMIGLTHSTGSLTIHFRSGKPSGMLEWKERSTD